MKYNPDIHHRRSIRLKGFDYSHAGAYFVTLCTQKRECLFGEIANGKVALSPYGQIVKEEWVRTAEIRKELIMDLFVVMPNHLHGIVFIHNNAYRPVGAHGRAPLRDNGSQRKPRSLGAFIAGFKSVVTKRINVMRKKPAVPVWQRNYYEHIIRNENELIRTSEYILNHPARWAEDENNPMVMDNMNGYTVT
jgi:REP element-mobilizing transposase RayT